MHAPVVYLINIRGWDVVLMHQAVDDGESIRKILCEITAMEVGDETVSDFLHGGEDALEGFDGMKFLRQ